MIENQVTSLLAEAEQAKAALPPADGGSPPAVQPFNWKPLEQSPLSATDDAAAPNGQPLDLRIELGHTRLHPDEAASLRAGSVVALDELIDEPVSVYAGGWLVARGEVLVVDGKLAVRVRELVAA